MDNKNLDTAAEAVRLQRSILKATQGILTPERDKRAKMGEEEEESTTDWSCEVATEENDGASTPWANEENSTLYRAVADLSDIQQKTVLLRGRRKRGRPKKQQKEVCKAS